MRVARGFHQDAYSEFRNRIVEAIDPQDLTSLRTLYQREYQQLPFSKDRQQHILNAILIKSYMKAIDETVTLTAEEVRVLHDYLFSVEIWGRSSFLQSTLEKCCGSQISCKELGKIEI